MFTEHERKSKLFVKRSRGPSKRMEIDPEGDQTRRVLWGPVTTGTFVPRWYLLNYGLIATPVRSRRKDLR